MLRIFSKNKIQTDSFIKYVTKFTENYKKSLLFKGSKTALCLWKDFSYNEEEITTNILIHSQD
jgi:hypothetical protein